MTQLLKDIQNGSFWLSLAGLVGAGVALFGAPQLAEPVKGAVGSLGLLVVALYAQQSHQTQRAATNAAAQVATATANATTKSATSGSATS